jgi:hypothetical protein
MLASLVYSARVTDTAQEHGRGSRLCLSPKNYWSPQLLAIDVPQEKR